MKNLLGLVDFVCNSVNKVNNLAQKAGFIIGFVTFSGGFGPVGKCKGYDYRSLDHDFRTLIGC